MAVRADLTASLDGSVLFLLPRLGCQIASLCFNGMIIIVSYSVHPKLSPAAPSTDWQTHGNLTNLFWPPLNQVVCEIIWLCIFPLGKLKNWWLASFFSPSLHLLLFLLRLQTAPLQYPAVCPRAVFILLRSHGNNCAPASQSGAAVIGLGSIPQLPVMSGHTLWFVIISDPPQVTLWYHWENIGLKLSNALSWSISSTTGGPHKGRQVKFTVNDYDHNHIPVGKYYCAAAH